MVLGTEGLFHMSTHIFVFRHCLRSTKSNVNLNDGNGKQSVQSFFSGDDKEARIIPSWNTPENWCTEEGINIMQRTGAWLAESTTINDLHFTTSNKNKLRVVSDTSQRDLDSALSLVNGILSGRDNRSPLPSIELNPDLFHPTKNSTFGAGPPLCDPVDEQIRVAQIQKRLGSIAPPSLLQNIWKLINDTVAPLKIPILPSSDIIKLNRTRLDLIGPVNFVKYMAQTLLYSRASSLLPQSSIDDQLQKLLPWIAWQRSIVDVGNSMAAQRGAVLINFLLEAMGTRTSENTIFLFGHDSTLNSLATALNVSWTLPFYGADSATPPGSAIHFYYDRKRDNVKSGADAVQMELLYPTYFSKGGSINSTGILESLPLASFDSWSEFKDHALFQLKQYPGAVECFENVQIADTARRYEPVGNDDIGLSLFGVLMAVVAVLSCVSCSLTSRLGRKRQSKQHSYTAVVELTR